MSDSVYVKIIKPMSGHSYSFILLYLPAYDVSSHSSLFAICMQVSFTLIVLSVSFTRVHFSFHAPS